jgi:uncharacterized membrane protein
VADQPASKLRQLGVGAAVGVAVGFGSAFVAPWQAVPLLGWAAASLTWVGWVWLSIVPLDPTATSRNATREDPHGPVADVLLLSASVAMLAAVILGVVKAGDTSGANRALLLGSGIAVVISSWGVVQTVFTLRYASLYYRGASHAVDFKEDDDPSYADFAYLAFTIGMTYQVSDTDLRTKAVRHTALRHALLSYLFGTVIIATTINLAAGLVH